MKKKLLNQRSALRYNAQHGYNAQVRPLCGATSPLWLGLECYSPLLQWKTAVKNVRLAVLCPALLCLLILMCQSSANAEFPKPVGEPLWGGGAPGVTASGVGDSPQLLITKVESDKPTAGVVILPGGGYGGHAIGHEGYDFAEWFSELGVTSAICTYRMRGKGNNGKGYGHPAPMMDAQRAIQTLRARAKELNVDPNRIGVIGFSAGGHLCSTVSTKFAEAKPESEDPIARVSSRPNFSILCYPVISFDKPWTHKGSQRNLLGSDPDPALVASLSNESQVSKQTPPTFIFHTEADTVVPVENALQYYAACKKHGVEAEMHVFPKGRHGVGLAKNLDGANQWPGLCKAWLGRIGMLEK